MKNKLKTKPPPETPKTGNDSIQIRMDKSAGQKRVILPS